MRKLLRYLRIAFSILCAIASVLMIAWWLRSYWWLDLALGRQYSITSLQGCILCGYSERPTRQKAFFFAQNLREMEAAGSIIKSGATFGFAFKRETQSIHLGLPHWLLAIAAAGLAAAPWLRWRFSVRTVLIAMTLVAMGLGWIVYWAQK